MNMSPILIAALIAGTAAVPAFAAFGEDSERLPVTYDAKHDQYCVSEEITGRHVPVRVCRTKAEWAQLGAVVRSKSGTKVAQAPNATRAE